MEKPWSVLYYETEQGKCEIREFITSRKPEARQKIAAWILLLEEKGPQVPRPYADLLKDGKKALKIKADVISRFKKREDLYDSFS